MNGVAEIATALDPEALLALLHDVEAEFGRARPYPNAPRVLDLDLLAYGNMTREGPRPPLLPHPRLAERGFVLAAPGGDKTRMASSAYRPQLA